MILKFNTPISLNKARGYYNNNVQFITSTMDYPNITAVEFKGDPRFIFKRKIIAPKVSKKSNKIVGKYNKSIKRLWNGTFNTIIESIKVLSKQEKIIINIQQKDAATKLLNNMKTNLSKEARKRFLEAYRLGKLRGQILSNQELDDELNKEDEKIIQDRLDQNEVYLAAFTDDIQTDMDKILIIDEPYDSIAEIEELVKENIQEPKEARASMYSMAALALVTAGMVKALDEADPELGEIIHRDGIWTLHPDENAGGEVCDGCLKNSGKRFSIQEFDQEYHTNDCLTNCRCDLDMGA